MINQQLQEIKHSLQQHASKEVAASKGRFFKTGKGEYGEGTNFIGITTPALRAMSKTYRDADVAVIETLLCSKIHEEKMLALFIMCLQFSKDKNKQSALYELYIKHLKHINNWDLVDCSAPTIVGKHLYGKDTSQLITWAQSKVMWKRRIAIIATQTFIRKESFDDTFKIAELLLDDKEDLIHKAVGWMLREVGDQDVKVLEIFLDKHKHTMPRTMLRYAIEKFPESKRKAYLKA
jgi:3-methyladenine DNA glycosylase AlkD